MRYRVARVDANQRTIVNALRSAFCGVVDLSAVGEGCPDLLVHGPIAPWPMVLLEVKNPKKPAADRVLTPPQVKFHDQWRGHKAVVHDVMEALQAVGAAYRAIKPEAMP